MGLDMYLKAKKYVSNYNFSSVEDKHLYKLTLNAAGFPSDFKSNHPCLELAINIGYWRKANAIHSWFVKNVQGGKDECQEAYVPREKLEELLQLCRSVSQNHDLAPKVLPTGSGFFFGGTEYGEYYFENLKYTIEILQSVLCAEHLKSFEIYYDSSW